MFHNESPIGLMFAITRWIHVGGDEVIVEKWWMSDHVRFPLRR